MKTINLFKNTLPVFMLIFSLGLNAQDQETKPLDPEVVEDLSQTTKMALGLQKERHIKGAFGFFDQMLKSDLAFDNFEIVIWSDVVVKLVKGTELADLIQQNTHPKLRVSVCQQALERMGVEEGDLPDEVHIVPNAFLRVLQIQAQGYNVVIP